MTIPVPDTLSAAQSNRQIQTWFEEYQAPETGSHRKAELHEAIEVMYLKSINQIRATRGLPPSTVYRSWFANRGLENPHTAHYQKRAAIMNGGVQPTKSYEDRDWVGYLADQTAAQKALQTPSAPVKPSNPVLISPAVDKALHALSGPLPEPILRWTQELDQANQRLKQMSDRSSPEARKCRKQIRVLKDKLGIPR